MDAYSELIRCCESISNLSLSTKTLHVEESSIESKIRREERVSEWLDAQIARCEEIIASPDEEPKTKGSELMEKLFDESLRLEQETRFLKTLLQSKIAQQQMDNNEYLGIIRGHAMRARDSLVERALSLQNEMYSIDESDILAEKSRLEEENRKLYEEWKQTSNDKVEAKATSQDIRRRIIGDLLYGSGLQWPSDPTLKRIAGEMS